LGKAKGWDENNSRREKRWNHPCWAETAFPANEGSLGGTKESCGEEVNQSIKIGRPSFPLSSALPREAG